ncbi:ABC transporter substrate-binding protein [Nibricoccus sp. IMCC34717]|uniref:ABC transporter substrate-binding protein n=1 Tax=Nibricoccus sp. IMCC34717 TaxID=3034021 RepID=UPI00384EDCF3
MKASPGIVVSVFSGIATLFAVVFLLSGGTPRSQLTDAKAANAPVPTRELTIAMDLWPGYYPLIAAHEAGLDKKHGLSLKFAFPQDTHRMIADFAGGRYDGVCAALGDMILAHQRDPDIRMILCTDESAGADQIIGSSKLADPRELVGRRISTNLGGFGELLVRRFLQANGVPPQKVSLVNADAADCVNLLKQGRIDAAHTWEPYASEGRAIGYTLLFSSKETPGLILDGLMVHARQITDDREKYRALIQSWIDGLEWWKANREEGDTRIRAHIRAAGLPDRAISFEGIVLHDAMANKRLFASDAPGGLDASAREFIGFFLERGSLSSAVDPQQMLDGTLLP